MIEKSGNFFILATKNTSYLMEIDEYGKLIHNYFGKKMCDCVSQPSANQAFFCVENERSDEGKLLEFPTFGHTDFRIPVLSATLPDGSTVTEFIYSEYEILKDKPNLSEMPSARGKNVPCLIITLRARNAPLYVKLYYSVYEECDVIVKNCRIYSEADDIVLDVAYSQSLTAIGFENVCFLAGSWARERHIQHQKLGYGITELGEVRGTSGHNINPFIALCRDGTTEVCGEVIGFNLIYSGNHCAQIERDRFDRIRINTGIHPYNFQAKLNKGDHFETPEAILTFSSEGYGKMSRNFHDFLNGYVINENWVNRPRPILINNWEATYFHFDEKKLLEIAQCAAEIGIELFVLDDGWFGKRDLDNCSLGDWVPYAEKLPNGIMGLAKKIVGMGMKFGLWFEPEMVSKNSELFQKHPDWVIRTTALEPATGRSQLVLNLAKPEVQDYLIEVLSEYLSDPNLTYVKWDMNRYLSDVPEKGFCHRYVLGLYRVLTHIKEKFPNVLMEGCSGGGGRFDCGMLSYFPQIWTSDDTDAVERLEIQSGTSMAYPLSCMSAHVTACPNHQTGRNCDMKTRAAVADFGVFGYELDITKEPERDKIAQQIAFHKSVEYVMRNGDFYRISEGNIYVWQTVSKDGGCSVVLVVRIRNVPNMMPRRIRLRGLREEKMYRVDGSARVYSGVYLMNCGLLPEFSQGDYQSQTIMLQEV